MSGRPPGRPVVVATRNPHKLAELGEVLTGFELDPLPGRVELPPEDGDTFAANALGKARAAHAQTGRAAIADDSGIAAAALGGAPGVRSARYAGEEATDAENLALLLAEVGKADDRTVASSRAARPRCETASFSTSESSAIVRPSGTSSGRKAGS